MCRLVVPPHPAHPRRNPHRRCRLLSQNNSNLEMMPNSTNSNILVGKAHYRTPKTAGVKDSEVTIIDVALRCTGEGLCNILGGLLTSRRRCTRDYVLGLVMSLRMIMTDERGWIPFLLPIVSCVPPPSTTTLASNQFSQDVFCSILVLITHRRETSTLYKERSKHQ